MLNSILRKFPLTVDFSEDQFKDIIELTVSDVTSELLEIDETN